MIAPAAKDALDRGGDLAARGHFEEAVKAFEEALRSLDPRVDAESRRAFVRAHLDAGVAHGNARRAREELAHYEIAISEAGGDESLEDLALRAMANSVTPLQELGRVRDAIARCGEIAARFAAKPAHAQTVAEAGIQKGVLQRMAGDAEAAETTLMAVLSSDAAAVDPVNWAFGVLTLGEILASRGDEEGAVRSAATLVRAAFEAPLAVRKVMAHALETYAGRLDEIGAASVSLAVRDAMLRAFGAAEDEEIADRLDTARTGRAAALDALDADGTLAAWDEAIAALVPRALTRPNARRHLALSRARRVSALAQAGRVADADAAWVELRASWSAEDPMIRAEMAEAVATALVFYAAVVFESGRARDAAGIFAGIAAIVERDAPGSDVIAAAEFNRGIALEAAGDVAAARAAWEGIVRRYGTDAGGASEIVESAREKLGLR